MQIHSADPGTPRQMPKALTKVPTRSVGVRGVNVLEDGKESASHNLHNPHISLGSGAAFDTTSGKAVTLGA